MNKSTGQVIHPADIQQNCADRTFVPATEELVLQEDTDDTDA